MYQLVFLKAQERTLGRNARLLSSPLYVWFTSTSTSFWELRTLEPIKENCIFQKSKTLKKKNKINGIQVLFK